MRDVATFDLSFLVFDLDEILVHDFRHRDLLAGFSAFGLDADASYGNGGHTENSPLMV